MGNVLGLAIHYLSICAIRISLDLIHHVTNLTSNLTSRSSYASTCHNSEN